MTPACVVVTGSREWSDKSRIRRDLSRFSRGTVLLHGGCSRGADAIADRVGRELGFDVRPVPVVRKLDGDWPGAGPRRSLRMLLRALDLLRRRFVSSLVVLAYPKPGAKNKGTFACMNLAEQLDIKVENRGDDGELFAALRPT